MTHLVPIRGGELPRNLVLIREGVNTLTDEALSQACRRAHELTGIRGFSVLELPAGGFEALARLRPLLRVRRSLRTADGHALAAAGFPLLPTWDYPHWSVIVSEADPEQFARVRALFSEPIPNPVFPTTRGLTWAS